MTTKHITTDAEISKAVGMIDHVCDGPMTAFVAISRACDLVASGEIRPEAAANALDTVLRAYGWIE